MCKAQYHIDVKPGLYRLDCKFLKCDATKVWWKSRGLKKFQMRKLSQQAENFGHRSDVEERK